MGIDPLDRGAPLSEDLSAAPQETPSCRLVDHGPPSPRPGGSERRVSLTARSDLGLLVCGANAFQLQHRPRDPQSPPRSDGFLATLLCPRYVTLRSMRAILYRLALPLHARQAPSISHAAWL